MESLLWWKRSREAVAALALLCVLCVVSVPSAAAAGSSVVTDGTTGPVVSLPGPDYRVGADLGTRAGANLFHSFAKFGVAWDESATFTGPVDIANVISRVTGGEVSMIDGLLKSEVGSADFYFINPAGIVFGENARVDVPAAFHASTANELRFGDGNVFSASDPGKSTLSVSSPEAFGFLPRQAASIAVNGTILTFKPGSAVSFSGGDLALTGSEEAWAGIKAQGGEVRLSAVGDSAATVRIDGSAPEALDGNFAMENARIGAYGDGGGEICVDAGDARIARSVLHGDNMTDRDGDGGVRLRVRNLDVVGSEITSDVWGGGDSGSVRINARETVTIKDGGGIRSSVFGDGDSGGVALAAARLSIDGGGQEWDSLSLSCKIVTGIASEALWEAAGKPGPVDIDVEEDVSIRNYAGVSTSILGEADAANITVNADELILDGGGQYAKITGSTAGAGNGGAVDIAVEGTLEMRSNAEISSTATSFGTGDGGNIKVRAGELRMADYAHITANADWFSQGKAGDVTVDVEGPLEMYHMTYITSSTDESGNAGKVKIDAGDILMDGYSSIVSEAKMGSQGKAGDVEVTAKGMLEMYNGANISTSTKGFSLDSTDNKEDAGNVTVGAGGIRMDAGDLFSFIASNTLDALGNAGTVEVTAEETLEMLNGSRISSLSFCSEGNAGRVAVHAGELSMDGAVTAISSEATGTLSNSDYAGNAGTVAVIVDGKLEMNNGAQISSGTSTKGDAGSVQVAAKGMLEMYNGANISASTKGFSLDSTDNKGDAGNVTVGAGGIRMDASWITSDSLYALGKAGTVEVTAEETLELIDGARISTSTNVEGDAGSVKVRAGRIGIDGGDSGYAGISSEALYGSGKAGTVEVTAEESLELIDGARISTSTYAAGDAGSVKIEAGRIAIDGPLSGFASQAQPGAAGMVGNVHVRAGQIRVSNEGSISIAHLGGLSDERRTNLLKIEAATLELLNGSRISARSEGNVPASDIELRLSDKLVVKGSSSVATSAKAGDGGDISVSCPGYALLEDGLVTTSTEGGRGGDIAIDVKILVLDTGFIQANTEKGAAGGDISVNARAVIASGNRLLIGGAERMRFLPGSGINVIQAAAPEGNPGNVVVAAPRLDVSATLVDVGADFLLPVQLITDHCLSGKESSSLALRGAGGLPRAFGAGPDVFFGGERMERLFPPR